MYVCVNYITVDQALVRRTLEGKDAKSGAQRAKGHQGHIERGTTMAIAAADEIPAINMAI